MDWLKDFEKNFNKFKELSSLKSEKFHGSVVLNFCNGEVMNYDYKLHRRAVGIDNKQP